MSLLNDDGQSAEPRIRHDLVMQSWEWQNKFRNHMNEILVDQDAKLQLGLNAAVVKATFDEDDGITVTMPKPAPKI